MHTTFVRRKKSPKPQRNDRSSRHCKLKMADGRHLGKSLYRYISVKINRYGWNLAFCDSSEWCCL